MTEYPSVSCCLCSSRLVVVVAVSGEHLTSLTWKLPLVESGFSVYRRFLKKNIALGVATLLK
jgi:hypothetical protein